MGDMNRIILAVFLAAIISSGSVAQDPQTYQCAYGDLQRRVEILYETGVTVPCEVHYFKDTEAPGERQVLWRALNEAGYCERKTQEFIAQLEEWGWDCGQGDDAGEQAEPAQADDSEQEAEPAKENDTESLAPVEEADATEE